MSVPVELTELADRIGEFPPAAFLVTVGESHAPHVVSVVPAWQGGELRVGAGARTRANVEDRERVSLLWPAPPGRDYCLIVDGIARVDDEGVALRPVRAVLHRMASADASLPSCVTVL